VRFYLGTHQPNWIEQTEVPLFVSRTRLAERKTLPRAVGPVAIDSGGFTALSKTGRWPITVEQYAEEVRRYDAEIGIEWAAPMDWMCEPGVRQKTGLGVVDHQERTVKNFLRLRELLGPLVIPVLQGWTRDDYLRCWEMYSNAYVGLEWESVVGVGSICRRGQDAEIVRILNSLRPLKMHAFGVRTEALAHCAHFLVSADSMAWSAQGRRTARRPGCVHPRGGKTEANCLRYALDWRERQMAITQTRLEVECAA